MSFDLTTLYAKLSKSNTLLIIVTVSILLSILSMPSCDESEPLPEGVSALPDLDASELAESLADESGVIQWPAELLPEGFPVPRYNEIYSVERADNIVTIILFGKKAMTTSDDLSFLQKLVRQGYEPIDDAVSGIRTYYNKEGIGVRVANSANWTGEHLKTINEKSPTGYTFEITVLPKSQQTDCLFWQYPDSKTDLGLEQKVFEEWPAEYLPKAFPRPGNGIEVLEMKQEKYGLFITIKGLRRNIAQYRDEINAAMGFIDSQMPFRNSNGDYMFVNPVGDFSPNAGEDSSETWQFQICPPNDKIIKLEQG